MCLLSARTLRSPLVRPSTCSLFLMHARQGVGWQRHAPSTPVTCCFLHLSSLFSPLISHLHGHSYSSPSLTPHPHLLLPSTRPESELHIPHTEALAKSSLVVVAFVACMVDPHVSISATHIHYRIVTVSAMGWCQCHGLVSVPWVDGAESLELS